MQSHIDMRAIHDTHVQFTFEQAFTVFSGAAGGDLGDIILR